MHSDLNIAAQNASDKNNTSPAVLLTMKMYELNDHKHVLSRVLVSFHVWNDCTQKYFKDLTGK